MKERIVAYMTKKFVKQLLMAVFALMLFCVPTVTANATQTENTNEEAEDAENTPLTFVIAIYTYEMLENATQADMPKGFTLRDWEYNGVAVKAGFTENSDMICVMGKDWETGYTYRFIYDPNHDMFVPYFGADIKNGYIYTIPMYEGAEVPYGFMEAYFVIQTVPMFTYMREDAELTQEEIAVGSLSEDNYLVFLMMDENGKEVHYTYDLVDRTFQRALLQKKDAEKVTELNEVIDELHADIGELNAINAERMNKRLTIIGILIAAVLVMAGVIVNLLLKISKMNDSVEAFEDEDDEDEVEVEESGDEEYTEDSISQIHKEVEIKKDYHPEAETLNIEFMIEDEYFEDEVVEAKNLPKTTPLERSNFDDEDIEILDLDLDDL